MDVQSERLDDSGECSSQDTETTIQKDAEDIKETSNTSVKQNNSDDNIKDETKDVDSATRRDNEDASSIDESQDDEEIEEKSEEETSTLENDEKKDVELIDEKVVPAPTNSPSGKETKSESPTEEVPLKDVEQKMIAAIPQRNRLRKRAIVPKENERV